MSKHPKNRCCCLLDDIGEKRCSFLTINIEKIILSKFQAKISFKVLWCGLIYFIYRKKCEYQLHAG